MNDVPSASDDVSADATSGDRPDSGDPATQVTAAAGRSDTDDSTEPFPWPPAAGESVLAAGARTWREAMLSPASFYSRMPVEAPLGGALVYFLALTVLGAGIQLFWDMIGLLVLPRPEESSAWSVVLPTTAGDALVSFFFAPFVLLLFLFIGSAISHGLLKLIGGAGQRYGATVRVFSYSQSPQLLVIVPFIGAIIAMFWALAISVIGLREVHRTTTTKAALAILLPAFAIAFMLLMLVVVVTIMGAALLAR